jgi:hypothetical protein
MSSITSRKLIRRKHIFWISVACNFLAFWLLGDFDRAADAAPLFDNFTKYIQAQSDAALTATNASEEIKTVVKTFLGVIPWAVILVIGGVCSWQAYAGYQLYEREDMSGLGKCALNIVVLLILTVASSAITDFVVGGTIGGGA